MANRLSADGKRCARYSIQYYRQVLSAWKTCDHQKDRVTHEVVVDRQPAVDCRQPVVAVEDHTIDDTIDDTVADNVNDITVIDVQNTSHESVESVPESPVIVAKKRVSARNGHRKRIGSKFIQFEADVELDSSKAFSDDIEDTQRELLDFGSQLSCIDDREVMDTQPANRLIGDIDSRAARDMKSVYLRSIAGRSVGGCHKFKLQYNYDRNIDVYSQAPTEEELQDYEMDSFCVPNDCIDFVDSDVEVDAKPERRLPSKRRKKFKRIQANFSP